MRATHRFLAMAASALLAAGPVMAADKEKMSPQDFVDKAAQGGLYEVEVGRLAQEKGLSAGVKAFGQQLITDHNKANMQLKAIATQAGLKVPDNVGVRHQAKLARLKLQKDADFDRAFTEQIMKDHEEDIEVFTTASASLDSPPLRKFAAETLPVLKHHHDMTRALPATATK